ncbi:hypothetical protein CK203_039339 [Vitis vinifera]|uniref:KIB1-4 beta-propeller domain-containing protein n=1 Tax=Vitis vinifera TaxID=29760 RepID=A0A438HGS7_VITVI|nr:hypothetical protein CK203_039339 [Vitis vinifera]
MSFNAVCTEWRNASCEKLEQVRANHKRHCSNHKRHCSDHQQLPLLMVPTSDTSRERSALLYDVTQKGGCKFYLRLPEARCRGSSHGWLIVVDPSFKVILVNPHSRKFIHLPVLQRLVFETGSNYLLHALIPFRCVLSVDPDENPNEYVLMDIVYKDGLFYVLEQQGQLLSCDVSGTLKVERVTPPDTLHRTNRDKTYLVESPQGHLFRVIKVVDDDRTTVGFVIYKLIYSLGNPRWTEVKSLGDVALFLGDNHSISVVASDFPSCQPNSIYFCEHYHEFYSLPDDRYDVGVFSLLDGAITPIYPYSRKMMQPRRLMLCSFWFSPCPAHLKSIQRWSQGGQHYWRKMRKRTPSLRVKHPNKNFDLSLETLSGGGNQSDDRPKELVLTDMMCSLMLNYQNLVHGVNPAQGVEEVEK